ncbi:hypothetical protein QBC44DRAFT_278442, partial [Cladorrhinum sp. PSN332]
MTALRHNIKHSPMYRLPEPAIVRLMIILDPVSLQCLRRTGHLFWQAFELRFILPVPAAEYLPWPRPPLPFLGVITDAECRTLATLLERDGFCRDCCASRRLPGWSRRVRHTTKRYLHCSGCHRDHPTCLFTPAQQKSEPRLCIGHTGHIRLCEHQVVKWSQIVAASKDMKNNAHYLIAECKKKSHLKACQLHPLGVSWKLFRSSNNNNNNNNNNTPSICPEYPRLVLLRNVTTGLLIKLSWSPHLDLRPLKTSACPAGTMNGIFTRLRQQQTRYICPKVDPGQTIESRIFDPINCTCFNYHKIKPLHRNGLNGDIGHMGSSWFQALEHESFRETMDRNGFGVYWCTDRSCRNYW